ncbi:MAG: peroxiredoxin-like family protein [Xanthomonadales bacterium]|nr:peroxiredoxin-like family protein [Xanthomonadales bacterium]
MKKSWLGIVLLIVASVSAAEVAPDAFSVKPLLAGERAPEFEAPSAAGEVFHFDPEALDRPTLIIFYRGGWCPYCNLHWAELRRIEDELLASGVDLIFLSADRPSVLAEAMEDDDAPRYHLLSDASMEIAEAFGIAFKVDEATVDRYLTYDIDLEAASGYDHHVLPAPATFLVDTDGVIKFQYVNPDYKVRLSPEVLLAVARTMPDRILQR